MKTLPTFFRKVALLAALFGPFYASDIRAQTSQTPIYDDALSAGFENWSWQTSANFASTQTVHGGAKSLAITPSGAWGGLYLHHSGLAVAGRQNLEFWIHGGATGGQQIQIYAEDTRGRAPVVLPLSRYKNPIVAAWQKITIPLVDLALGSSPLTGLVFQNATNGSQATYFLDDIALTGSGLTPTPFAPPPFGDSAPRYVFPSAPVGTIPGALGPNFVMGLASQPDELDWIRNSGGAWAARYQYLTSGTNTGNGWRNWNSPDGAFASFYLEASKSAGILPIFTYYQLLPSNPAPYNETPEGYRQKFASKTGMKDYFADFRVLMRKCGSFNAPVIVHVEPDLWGYIQKMNAEPAQTAIQIAASGDLEAVGLPDNAIGLAQMLARIQRKYAPKTVLALHASMWAAGADVAINRSATYDVAAHARATGAFFNKIGAGWPLIFVDFADRDAVYKQIVRGFGGTWWDTSNARLPNFSQAHFWLSHLNKTTNRRLMVWQIPIGNTVMRACDNTSGHYQDNRVQFYFGNTDRLRLLVRCGVIGLLWGRGDGNTTTNTDARGDGFTNPAPIGTNTRNSRSSDDDGGFLRERMAIYSAAPVGIR